MYPYGDFPGGPEVKTCASTAGGTRSICGWGTKILHAMQHSQINKYKIEVVSAEA